MNIPSPLMYLSPEEVNNILLVLLCNKLEISPEEILNASTIYLEERNKTRMLYSQGGEYNA